MQLDHPYVVKFWYPANVAEIDATYKVIMKAPEFGDTYAYGRIQTQVRTRSGAMVTYDHGTPLAKPLALKFLQIPDNERSALIILLDLVNWGATPIAYEDYEGTKKIVLIANTSIPVSNTGYYDRDAITRIILFDFSLDFVDVTNNILDVTEYQAMPSALSLHIADTNAPHSPEVAVSIDDADGVVTLDSFLVDSAAAVIWVGYAESGNKKVLFQTQVTHDGYASTDATAIVSATTFSQEQHAAITDITMTVVLVGAGTSQNVALKLNVSTDGWTVKFRRIYFGKAT